MKEDRMQNLTVKISQLGEKVSELQRKREQTIQRYEADAKERSGALEISVLEDEIKSGENQIQAAKAEAMRINRDKILEEATSLSNEKKVLQEKIADIDRKGLELQEIFEKNIPRKRIQIESKNFIRIKKQVESPGLPAFDIHGDCVPNLPKQYHTVEDVTSAISLAAYFAAGWELCDGETVPPPEELTEENSREVITLATPDIFLNFIEVIHPPAFIPVDLGRR